MHFFSSLTTLALLFVSNQAKPIFSSLTTRNNASPSAIFDNPSPENSVNDCGDSTFVNKSSDGSPLVSDCLVIASNIAGGGTWTTSSNQDTARKLVSYGTCAFDVICQRGFPDEWYKVGNQDIIDLIHDSINRFQWNGLVGAQGDMNCQVEAIDGGIGVSWGLYHN
jgi:Pathogen effector